MRSNRQGRMRLGIELPLDMYYCLEKGAHNANTTLTIYVMRALTDKFFQEGIEITAADRKLLDKKIDLRSRRLYSPKK